MNFNNCWLISDGKVLFSIGAVELNTKNQPCDDLRLLDLDALRIIRDDRIRQKEPKEMMKSSECFGVICNRGRRAVSGRMASCVWIPLLTGQRECFV